MAIKKTNIKLGNAKTSRKVRTNIAEGIVEGYKEDINSWIANMEECSMDSIIYP